MKIKFLNKGIDAINLPQLLKSQSVMDKIPAYFKDKEPPIISYQYTNTVANKLFNFSSTLSNLDITNYLSNPQHCQCNTSKFCYERHGHVITGDLMVTENVKLRELVAKGPKYREPKNWRELDMLVVMGVMHEADNAYSIRSTWLCYRLVQFLITAYIC